MARHSSRYLDVSPASLTSTTTTTTSPTDQAEPRPHRSIDSSKQSSSSIGFNSLGLNLSTLVPDYARTPNLISPLALSPVTPSTPNREESTRIQLQRQKLREQKANALLSTAIPGYRTSAAFFASLRTNLRLNASPPPSPMSTPPSMKSSATSLPPPSPLAAPADTVDAAEDALAGVPDLVSYRTDDEVEKIAALKLVADSVAQMRQNANNHLTAHPLNLAVLVGIIAISARYILEMGRDWLFVGMSSLGFMMCALAGYRYFTQDYIYHAETFNWAWLGDADVIVTKFGKEIIGTVVIDWVSGESRQKKKKAWRGEIKGWTVRLKYRKKGVGYALLEDAVQAAKLKGAESIEFSDNHANSLRVLPAFYNKPFDRRDQKSRQLLQDLFENSGSRSKRK